MARSRKGYGAASFFVLKCLKTTLYDLFELHATARGELVASLEAADTVFSLDAGITPFDTELIVGEYL